VVETVGVYFASSDIRLISSYAVLLAHPDPQALGPLWPLAAPCSPPWPWRWWARHGSYRLPALLLLAILADIALAVSWALFSRAHAVSLAGHGGVLRAGAYATAVVGGRLAWPLPVLAGAAVGGAMASWSAPWRCDCSGPYFAVFTFGLAELAKHTLDSGTRRA